MTEPCQPAQVGHPSASQSQLVEPISITPPDQARALQDAFELPPNAVHVWWFSMEQARASSERHRASLSPDEIQRAERYIFPRHGQHYLAARGTLREILSSYLRTSPELLRFEYGAQGKPAL